MPIQLSPLGDEFLASGASTTPESEAAIDRLAGGGFVLAWTDQKQSFGLVDIKAQRFDASGAKVGPELVVEAKTGMPYQTPAVAGLASGNFVLSWSSLEAAGDSSEWGVRAQIYGPSGIPTGGPFLVNSTTSSSQHGPSITSLASGGFVITWQDQSQSSGDSSGYAIRGQLFDSGGAKSGGEFLVNTVTFSDQVTPEVTALESGGFVVTWLSDGDIKGQIFTSAGIKSGGEFLVNSVTAGYQYSQDVAGLPGGGFVATWTSPDVGGSTGVNGQIFDGAGNKVGPEFLVNTTVQGSQLEPSVTALAQGGFLIGWSDIGGPGGDPYGTSVRAQLFDALGNKLGGEFLLNSSVTASESQPVVTQLTTNEIVAAWGDGYDVKARIFLLPGYSGTESDDIYTGTDGGDIYRGLGGNDQIYGLGGNDDLGGGGGQDRIEGGGGDDKLRGDGGDDILIGGVGDDDYSGGDGIDTLDFSGETEVTVNLTSDSGVFSNNPLATRPLNPGEAFDSFGNYEAVSGIENLILTPGDDFAVGGDQANRFEGGAGDDALSGGGGNDVLLGGAGFDGLVGGAGDDTLEGGGDDDELVGGEGDDRLDGGSGTDRAGYSSAAAAVTVSLALPGVAQDTGGAGVDTLIDIEDLFGSAFGDTLTGNDLANVLNGNGGADIMRGGAGDDVYVVQDAGDSVEELAGQGVDTIRTSLAVYSLAGLVNVENLRATGPATARDFRGNAGNNVITGGSGSDVLRLYDGGDDIVFGGAGSDNIFFIGSLTSADVVVGGSETDTLVLQGPYGSLTLTANITEIENISILGGNNTNFGEPGTNRYDYVLVTNDANFAAALQVRINGAALQAGEDFTFDGSAETDAKFVVFGGKGVDTLTGGLGHDIFFFAEDGRFATGDTVNGGPGYDGMFLRGNYTIDFNAPGYTGLFTNIENLTLTSATDERYARGGGSEFDYNLVLSDAIVKPGETLTVSGALLMATETMILDASQETDGFLRLFGGKAADTLKGGANADLIHGNLGGDLLTGNGGADVFRYDSTAESSFNSVDQITDFTPGTDKVDLSRIDANTLVAGDQAFAWIGSSAFTGQAGELRASAFMGNAWILEGDTDGNGQPDLFMVLALQGQTPLSAGDFML